MNNTENAAIYVQKRSENSKSSNTLSDSRFLDTYSEA